MGTVLILSPHLDDVAFSIGGTLAVSPALCRRAVLATVFSRSIHLPFAFGPVDEETATAVRLSEDRQFAKQLGIEVVHCGMQEGMLCGYPSIAALFDGRGLVQDGRLPSVLARVEELLAARMTALTLAPMAIGAHIEHRLVRECAIQLTPPDRLIFYEDLPYAAFESPPPVARALGQLVQLFVTLPSFNVKRASMRAYPSQLRPDEEAATQVYSHALAPGSEDCAERFWGTPEALSRLQAMRVA